MSDLTVARTILEQMGGNKFVAMTGSKNFVGDDYSLTMTLARNQSKANRLKITLSPMDDYTMEFYRYKAGYIRIDEKKLTASYVQEKHETIKKLDGIYFDQLQDIFTDVTGLYTHF